ncbi:hypothetical protein DL768_004839 [Monosporascus sp. mg162]|nr:hypothetical protein DL768_004839 [Monosporascus sp. mg162]
MTSNIRYSPEPQTLYAHMLLARISQRSFLFYIIANVGPGKTHQPLAITFRQSQGASPGQMNMKALQDRVNHVIQDCVRPVNILTEPASRIALEAELCLAARWYQGNEYKDPDRAEVQDSLQPAFNFSIYDERQERPELPWAGSIREFPFISICLRLSLNCDDTYNTRVGDVQEQSLGTVFRDDRLEYGIVVLDISDLDRASADLLRLAYAGPSHLNWVAYKNLSYKLVTIALQSEELKDATALSLCIDRIGGSPTVLLEILSRSKTIKDVCFLQEPTRTNDDLASQLFAQLCASPSNLIHASDQQDISDVCVLDTFAEEVLAPGPKEHFTSTPPDLLSYKKKSSGMTISPISAEDFAIPGRCSITRTGSGEATEHQRECWPLLRDLESGSWVVLISHEWSTGVPYLRYAFIRARQRIVVPDDRSASPGRLEGLVRPEYVEAVGTVNEFLQETTSEVDTALLDRPMNEMLRILKARWPTELVPGMSYISVLDDGEARSILRDFLEDAICERELEASDAECNWYPKLPETNDAQGKQHRARNTAILKSLLDPDVEGEHPLGAERMVYAENNDDDL